MPARRPSLQCRAVLLERRHFSLPGVDQLFLFPALASQTLELLTARMQALAGPLYLGIKLLQQVAGGHGLLFSFPFFALAPVEQGSELFDFAPQRQDSELLAAQGIFQVDQQAHHVAQLALHGKWALGSLLASSDGHIMKTLA